MIHIGFCHKVSYQPNMKPQPLSTLNIRFPLPCSFHAHYPLVFHPKRNDVFLLLSLKKKLQKDLEFLLEILALSTKFSQKHFDILIFEIRNICGLAKCQCCMENNQCQIIYNSLKFFLYFFVYLTFCSVLCAIVYFDCTFS